MTPKQRAADSAFSFKERLKTARKLRGLTQDELASKSELSSVTLSKLETGINRPTYEVLVAVASALEVSPNFLLGWADDFSESSSGRTGWFKLMQSVADLDDDVIEHLRALVDRIK
jgi:transcriptional regulator with XRE-family HTH domain